MVHHGACSLHILHISFSLNVAVVRMDDAAVAEVKYGLAVMSRCPDSDESLHCYRYRKWTLYLAARNMMKQKEVK